MCPLETKTLVDGRVAANLVLVTERLGEITQSQHSSGNKVQSRRPTPDLSSSTESSNDLAYPDRGADDGFHGQARNSRRGCRLPPPVR